MGLVLVFIVVIAIIYVIVINLLKIYGIDARKEIRKIMLDAKKEADVDCDDDFTQIYNDIRNENANLEKKIRSAINIISKSEIILVALAGIFTIVAIANLVFLLISLVCLAVAIVLLLMRNGSVKRDQAKLKEKMMPEYLKKLNDTFEFNEDGDLSERSYKLSGFDTTFNMYKSFNYLEGNLDTLTQVFLAELDVKYEKNLEGRRTIENIFEGTFGYTNLNRKFEKGVKILLKPKTELTEMVEDDLQSKKFSEVYDVFTDDPIFTKIFDKPILKSIMGYVKHFGIKVEFIIQGSTMYFRFYNKDLISYKNFGSNEEKLALWKYYCMIQLIYVIVDKINNMEGAE